MLVQIQILKKKMEVLTKLSKDKWREGTGGDGRDRREGRDGGRSSPAALLGDGGLALVVYAAVDVPDCPAERRENVRKGHAPINGT